MSIEAATGTYWELSWEAEQTIRGETPSAPVPTLEALAELREIEPEAGALDRAIERTADRLSAHVGGSQAADLAALRRAAGGLPYSGGDRAWYWIGGEGPWVEAEISHYEPQHKLWCVRLRHTGSVSYAAGAELRPQRPGEIAPGLQRFGP